MAKKPTIYDVAERAAVSIATVSLSFTQPHRVRESTRKLVMEAAHELGYLPSASARGLAFASLALWATGAMADWIPPRIPSPGTATGPISEFVNIRINGTVVGSLAGLVIYAVAQVLF